MRAARLIPLLLLPAAVGAAPAGLDHPWQAGQRWTHTGTAEVIDLSPESPGLHQLHWRQDLVVVAPDDRTGGWRLAGIVEEREAMGTGSDPAAPVVGFFSGRAVTGGQWLAYSRRGRPEGLFPCWSPQLSVVPLPSVIPERETLEASWPIWAGTTRLVGEFRVRGLGETSLGDFPCHHWRARLCHPLSDTVTDLRVVSWVVEVWWDPELERPLQVQTTATVEWPDQPRQVQARMTMAAEAIVTLAAEETATLPEQLRLVERLLDDPAEAEAIVAEFEQRFPGGTFTEMARALTVPEL